MIKQRTINFGLWLEQHGLGFNEGSQVSALICNGEVAAIGKSDESTNDLIERWREATDTDLEILLDDSNEIEHVIIEDCEDVL